MSRRARQRQNARPWARSEAISTGQVDEDDKPQHDEWDDEWDGWLPAVEDFGQGSAMLFSGSKHGSD